MTIHHDKLGYGKLVSSREDVSEERLLEMARLLSECEELTNEEDATKKAAEKNNAVTGK